MRLGTVIGRVTLSLPEPAYVGGRLLLVQPFSLAQYAGQPALPLAPGASLVVYDELGAAEGSIVGYVEGPEASQPFAAPAPVDAYLACLVTQINYAPPA